LRLRGLSAVAKKWPRRCDQRLGIWTISVEPNRERSANLFAKFRILCYIFPFSGSDPWPVPGEEKGDGEGVGGLETFGTERETGVDFFIWIGHNPLKSRDSDE
jgi:hypothetical protein